VKVKLILEYDGTPFCGWQQQDGLPTVQGELERALAVYCNSRARKHNLPLVPPPSIMGSGRTDSGVHALGQVASFRWPESLPFDAYEFRAAMNGITPREISLRSVAPMPDTFDARISRHRKQYSYAFGVRRGSDGFHHHRLWHIRSGLDIPAMIRAARCFRGEHDFSSFRAIDCVAKSSVRKILLSEICRTGPEQLVFIVQGNGFLKQMIRIMAGTLLAVGKGRLSADDIPGILAARSREQAGPTAPAHALTLDWVRYSDGESAAADENDE
jgi:tRNA pseudouridine38-40 synthase